MVSLILHDTLTIRSTPFRDPQALSCDLGVGHYICDTLTIGSTPFRDPQALSCDLGVTALIQPRAFRSLNVADSSISVPSLNSEVIEQRFSKCREEGEGQGGRRGRGREGGGGGAGREEGEGGRGRGREGGGGGREVRTPRAMLCLCIFHSLQQEFC